MLEPSSQEQPVYVLVRTPYATVDAAVQGLGLKSDDNSQLQCTTHVVSGVGAAILPGEGTDVSSAKPHERIMHLQFTNSMLRAELDDLHAKLRDVEGFKGDVLETIKSLKQEVSTMSEEVLMGNSGDW